MQEIVGSDVNAKIASVLAVSQSKAHSIGSSSNLSNSVALSAINEYLAAIKGVRDLKAFAAVVYSSNFEFEVPDVGADEQIGGATRINITDVEKEELLERVDKSPETGDAVGGEAGLIEAEGGLEQAWEKALAKEDGIKTE